MTMSGKPKKPPIDKKSVLERLDYAQEHRLLVRVRRWIPDADRLEGFVVGVGKKWVVLQRLSDRVAFDGWQLLRVKDIQAVSIDPDPNCFEVKALKVRSLWPPTAPELALDSVLDVLATVSVVAPMLSVFDEFDRPDVCWIGAVRTFDESKLRLLEVNTRGGWARKPRTFDPADVTRLDFGGGYEEALNLVAGSPPGQVTDPNQEVWFGPKQSSAHRHDSGTVGRVHTSVRRTSARETTHSPGSSPSASRQILA